MDLPADGKLRVTCTGCGKRFKVPPDKQGAAFTCPHCKTTLIVPSDGHIPMDEEADSQVMNFVRRLSSRSARVSGTAAEDIPEDTVKLPGETPPAPEPKKPRPRAIAQTPDDSRPPAIDRLTAFLVKEQHRVGRSAARILRDPTLGQAGKRDGLVELRREKARRAKAHVTGLMRELDARLGALKMSPKAETPFGRRRIRRLREERGAVELFLRVMYQVKTLRHDLQDHDDAQDTA
jgi:ribosomal protein S27E